MKLRNLLIPAAAAVLATLVAFSADEKPRGPGGGGKGGGGGGGGGRRGPDGAIDDPRFLFKTEVPVHAVDVVLGRPTKDSITASILAYADREGVIAYGPRPGTAGGRAKVFSLAAGTPTEITLSGLSADTSYFYTLSTREKGGAWKAETERTFHTARPAGKPFTFAVQADSHLDYGIDLPTYEKSLANVLASKPDFFVDLGDTFMVDKRPSYTLAGPQYVAQRYYFGLVGHSVPVFLTLGNHDGETLGRGRGGDKGEMAIWSNGMRKKYFPNPTPGGFYSGNTTAHPQAGLLADYYAWEWGDALFVALDQFWYSQQGRKGEGDNWSRTLGKEQYDWLRRTLETSQAKYTFVFTHHLVGGQTPEGRGGVEASHFFEWGGKELDGTNTFAQKRPGWPAPIHELLARRGGCVVFHGHDHFYVHAERDGVTYQLVPQPGHERVDNTRTAAEYGYLEGVKAGASGILRVNVSPQSAVVEYVRAYPASAEDATHRTGTVSHRYEVRPR